MSLRILIGYDTRAMRRIIAIRKRDKDDYAEEKALVQLYADAIGLEV